MILDRPVVSATFEPIHATGAEASWIGDESGSQEPVVRGKRILLVEDEERLRVSLRLMLELDGHQVTEACNGAEALHTFTLGDFELVITDLQMPVMEGSELAVSIKLLAPSLPVLMITASENARAGIENPVDALLGKPVTLADLRGALGKLFFAPTVPVRGEAEWVRSDAGSLVCR